jgi:hypothetical protein
MTGVVPSGFYENKGLIDNPVFFIDTMENAQKSPGYFEHLDLNAQVYKNNVFIKADNFNFFF